MQAFAESRLGLQTACLGRTYVLAELIFGQAQQAMFGQPVDVTLMGFDRSLSPINLDGKALQAEIGDDRRLTGMGVGFDLKTLLAAETVPEVGGETFQIFAGTAADIGIGFRAMNIQRYRADPAWIETGQTREDPGVVQQSPGVSDTDGGGEHVTDFARPACSVKRGSARCRRSGQAGTLNVLTDVSAGEDNMSFYEDHILPHLIGAACGSSPIMKQRQKLVPAAEGRVLEIGMGAGPNLQFYDPSRVTHLWGLEPSPGMRRKARRNIEAAPVDVELIDLPGEQIPLDDNSVDTVVLTYTLCTIPDAVEALQGMRRVLKPGGKLLFCEHGKAPDAQVLKWQNRVEPAWKVVAGGCHLTRDIPALIRQGGFDIEVMEQAYIPDTLKIAAYDYWGSATG